MTTFYVLAAPVAVALYGLLGGLIGRAKWRIGNPPKEELTPRTRAVRYVLWPHGIDRWSAVRDLDNAKYLRVHMYIGLPWLIMRLVYFFVLMLVYGAVRIVALVATALYVALDWVLTFGARYMLGTVTDYLTPAGAYAQVQGVLWSIADFCMHWNDYVPTRDFRDYKG